MRYRIGRGWRTAALLLAAAAPQLARAQSNQTAGDRRLGPDLLQTLGVGSRSIAMGNAFSAIADDASATFWNPARLGFIPRREFMIEYRPVFNTNATQIINVAPTGSSDSFTPGFSPGKPQLGFASFLFNIGPNQSVGVSYTLGGYASQRTRFDRTQTALDGTITKDTGVSELRVRNSFLTIAYGRAIPFIATRGGRRVSNGTLGVGVGVYFLNQEYTSNSSDRQTTVTLPDNTQQVTTPIVPRIDERGRGYGINFGISYDAPRRYHLGLAYRTGAHLSGLNQGELFNDETPDRAAFGVAYETRQGKDNFLVSTELELLGAANRRIIGGVGAQVDRRRDVSNLHLGIEYTPGVLPWDRTGDRYRLPIRAGFRTNRAQATSYTFNDNVASFGFAFQSLYPPGEGRSLQGVRYSIEPVVEMLTSNGASQLTLTGRVVF